MHFVSINDKPPIRLLRQQGNEALSVDVCIGAQRQLGARTPVGEAAAARLASGMGNRTSAALEGLPQVTIGAINGLTIGGAVVFASCLDIRIAARSAWFSIPVN